MTQSAPQNDLATDDVADAAAVPAAAPTTPAEQLEPGADAGVGDVGAEGEGAEGAAKKVRDPVAKLEREGDIAADFL